LTTSDAPSDIAKAYEQKIAGYIIKENAYDTVKAAMEMLGAFVEIVSLEGRPQLQAAAQ
jgi:DNA-binding NarL/FixJ family response regulator